MNANKRPPALSIQPGLLCILLSGCFTGSQTDCKDVEWVQTSEIRIEFNGKIISSGMQPIVQNCYGKLRPAPYIKELCPTFGSEVVKAVNSTNNVDLVGVISAACPGKSPELNEKEKVHLRKYYEYVKNHQ